MFNFYTAQLWLTDLQRLCSQWLSWANKDFKGVDYKEGMVQPFP